jgi:protein-S-isoprenylcysteine O-methyltransferase Ste14
MWLFDRHAPMLRLVGTPWHLFGWSVIAIGVGMDLHAVVTFMRTRTTVNPMRVHHSSRLVVTGLYRISRNPMYLGLVLALSGWALLLGSPLTLLLVWALARILEVVQIVPEEAVLRVKFGSAYVDYSMRVHRWFGVARVWPT